MIHATWIGGPMDGQTWTLEDNTPVTVKVLMAPPSQTWDTEGYEIHDAPVDFIDFHPVLTTNGWRLYWREP